MKRLLILLLFATPVFAQVTVTGGAKISGSASITVVAGGGGNPTTPPICGSQSTANLVPNATAWTNFVPPAVGSTYTDSGYCPVTRVTNTKGTAQCAVQYYATQTPFSADDSLLMLYDCNSGSWFIDAGPTNTLYSVGTSIITESGTSGLWSHDSEPTWDRTTGNVFWSTLNNQIRQCTVNNSAKTVSCSTVNHTFSEYSGYRISFMDETDMTPDGWLVTVGQNAPNTGIAVFLWNPTTLTKSSVYTTGCTADINSSNNGCIHKLIATPLDGVVIQFEGSTNPENGNQLWESPFSALQPVELNSGGTGPGGQGGTDHFDSGKNGSGTEVGNFEDFLNDPGPWGNCSNSFRPTTVTLPPASNTPQCLFSNRASNPGWHVSWRGYPSTQYVAYSAQANVSSAEFFNNNGSYVAPSTSNWQVYDNEIVDIQVGANNSPSLIWRLALAHARGNPGYFWSDPRAAESYDGKYIGFSSNSAWSATGCGTDGGGSCSDFYIVKIH